MSFEYAPVAKGLMMVMAASSLLVGLFDIKHDVHLQLVPHLSSQHQYWRLGAHYMAFSSSAELFMAELLMYHVGIHVERQFGSVKFASFAVVSTLLSISFEFMVLLLFHNFGLNIISSGPSTLLFSILYQYSRIVPAAYDFRIFGLPLNNKSFQYFLALQLAMSRLPSSGATAIIGVLVGQMYRSDLVNLKFYRIPPTLTRLMSRLLMPLIGSTRAPRRSNRAFPEPRVTPNSVQNEVVTTSQATTPPTNPTPPATGTSVMREWVNELTGRSGLAVGIRAPTDAEITQVSTMFPDMSRETVTSALQRSPNIEGAVETLLRSQA